MSDVDNTGTGDGRHLLDDLPADIRGHDYLRGMDTPEKLARRIISQKQELDSRPGKDSIVVPGERATAADRRKYQRAMGIPEKAEDYDLGELMQYDPSHPEELPKAIDKGLADSMRAVFHENGLSQTQARKLWDTYLERSAEVSRITEQEAGREREASLQRLQEEYGDQLEERHKTIAVFRAMAVGQLPDDATDEQKQAHTQRNERFEQLCARQTFKGGLGADADFKWLVMEAMQHVQSDRFMPDTGPPAGTGTGTGTGGGRRQQRTGDPLRGDALTESLYGVKPGTPVDLDRRPPPPGA